MKENLTRRQFAGVAAGSLSTMMLAACGSSTNTTSNDSASTDATSSTASTGDDAQAASGKAIVPFSTSAGSGLAGFDNKLASSVSGATIGTGFTALGTDAQNNQDSVRSSVGDWLTGLGL